MTCPSCGGELVAGMDRCPVCDDAPASVPRVEGALAADPRLVTPPSRGRAKPEAPAGEPIRDIPGLRRRESRERPERVERPERSWRDEVQERIRSRRQKRTEAGLPLFEQEVVRAAEPDPAPKSPGSWVAPPAPVAEATTLAEPEGALLAPSVVLETRRAPAPLPAPVSEPVEPDATGDSFSPGLSEAELADLPLRTSMLLPESGSGATGVGRHEPPSLDDEALLGEPDIESGLDLAPPAEEATPVERPAGAGERAQAGALDLALFAAIATVAVYFAGRAARVDLPGLAGAWPWLLAFLGLLAAFYACYFTGTTGQTPGKLITHLHVVDVSGRPPSYGRALGRAFVGLLGAALLGLGFVPMALDPAGRALHDRLFRTRVVRR